MAKNRITIIIDGPASENGHVRLSHFLAQLQALRRALLTLEKMASGGKVRAYYRVVSLKHESPATVEVERVERTRDVFDDTPPAPVIESLFGAVREIEKGESSDADRDLLNSLRAMTAPVGRGVRSTILHSEDEHLNLTPQLGATVKALLAPEVTAMGSVSGRLERINFHASANTFHVYPMIGPSRVACRFPMELTADAERAVNRYVTVSGELRYKSNADFPFAVEVTSIEVMPGEGGPGLAKLRGVAPDATDDLSAEEFIWRIRDEW